MTKVGFIFPGLNSTSVKDALENRKKIKNFLFFKPTVQIKHMDSHGRIEMLFHQHIMVPYVINQTMFDDLFIITFYPRSDHKIKSG